MRKSVKRGKFRNKPKRNKTRRRQKGGMFGLFKKKNMFNNLITREALLNNFAKKINVQTDDDDFGNTQYVKINAYSQEALSRRLKPNNVFIGVIDNTNPDREFSQDVYNRVTGIYYCTSDTIRTDDKKLNKWKELYGKYGEERLDEELFAWMKMNVLDVIMGRELIEKKDVSFQAIPMQEFLDEDYNV
jgi:hypothetical protein